MDGALLGITVGCVLGALVDGADEGDLVGATLGPFDGALEGN